MSLEFAIIPSTSIFITAAYNIETKLKENVKLEMSINIDTNYEQSFISRINKWKKQGFDIITIDNDYDVSKTIVVRFSDKGSRAQSMEVDEFIDLVSSFEDDTPNSVNNNDSTENKNTNTENSDQDGGCIIM